MRQWQTSCHYILQVHITVHESRRLWWLKDKEKDDTHQIWRTRLVHGENSSDTPAAFSSSAHAPSQLWHVVWLTDHCCYLWSPLANYYNTRADNITIYTKMAVWGCWVLLPRVISKGRTNELTKILIVFNLEVLITAWNERNPCAVNHRKK